MSDQIKRGRGRPPKPDAVPGADRQRLYAAARQRDMSEVAFALKMALARSKTERSAFVETYRGTPSGVRLRRGLGRMLTGDPETLEFFDRLLLSGDGN